MGRDTFNILFYLRRNKLLKDGTVPIFMRITINGKRWDSSLQLGVDLNNWDNIKNIISLRLRLNKNIVCHIIEILMISI